jgi:hypothetical protein
MGAVVILRMSFLLAKRHPLAARCPTGLETQPGAKYISELMIERRAIPDGIPFAIFRSAASVPRQVSPPDAR